VPDGVVPAPFEDVAEPHDVAVDHGARIFHRVAHACLCCEVDYSLGFVPREHVGDRLRVAEVAAHERELRMLLELPQTRSFQGRIVVVIQVVEPDDFVSPRQQPRCDVKADEPGCTRYQNLHLCLHSTPLLC
jgi:hypothetical protein